MSPEQIGGLVGAIGTFLLGLYGAYRLAKADKYKASSDNAALLLTGWRDLQKSISEEVERVKKSCAEQLASLRDDHDRDRQEWFEERESLKKEIETLKAQVFKLMEITERPKHVRTRKTDKVQDS